MVDSLLVPFDGSEPASEALEFATGEYPLASTTVLHVIDTAELVGGGGADAGLTYADILEQREAFAEDLLESARDTAASHGVDVDTVTLTGPVAQSIVEYATEHDVDQIVIGSHGRTGVGRVLLGSVAESVTRRAPVPVTVVR